MTTIAWDGKILAADTQATSNGMPRIENKVFKLNDGRLYAACGSSQDGYLVLTWLNEGSPKKEKPEIDNDFEALVINIDGSILKLQDKLVFLPLQEKIAATGSGRDYALAAMLCGKSAIQSILIASELCCYTNDKVTAYHLQSGTAVEPTPADYSTVAQSLYR